MPLGGVKQRATLGFLLLKANQVVPTSTLLKALWTEDDAPASARKMLQNAVWGLRAALGSAGCSDVQLCTQSPGYVLKVDPAGIDLHEFTTVAGEGRSLLAAGEFERAATVLRAALSTWRGAALADLVETGVCWPELTALEKSRLATMEDYFDAELGSGRHHEVLAELETLVETEPLRERACGQLMLALYRCGRHADALSVYGRLRTALVEDLGLEPGPELRTLQQAILNHDPSLALPRRRRQSAEIAARPAETPRTGGNASPGDAPAVPDDPAPSDVVPFEPAPAPRSGAPEPPRPQAVPEVPAATQRRRATVVLVRVGLGEEHADGVPADVDALLAGAAAMARAGIEQLGGRVVASIGSTTLALFGSPGREDDAALRAVRAAVLLRDSLGHGTVVTSALTTGEVLLRYHPEDRDPLPSPQGALVDRCLELLSRVPAGQVWLCDTTHALVRDWILCSPVPGGHWAVHAAHGDGSGANCADQESELTVVRGLLDRTRRRRHPHLVTVLGDAPRTVSSFLAALSERVDPDSVLLVRGRCAADDPLAAHAAAVADLCGIEPHDDPARVAAKVEAALRGSPATPLDGPLLVKRLTPLLSGRGPLRPTPDLLGAWQAFLEHAAGDRTIVAVLEDVHVADEAVLDWVEHWVCGSLAVPLLVVVTANSELTTRRPGWGAGIPHAASITLDYADDQATDRLRQSILSTVDGWTKPLARRLLVGAPDHPGRRAAAHRSTCHADLSGLRHGHVVAMRLGEGHRPGHRGATVLHLDVPTPARLAHGAALSAPAGATRETGPA